MRFILFACGAVCFIFSVASIWFLSVQLNTTQESLYWSPLSDDRLEARLKTDRLAPDETLAVAQALIARDPRNYLAQVSLAEAYLRKGDISALEQHFYPLFNISRSNSAELVKFLVVLSADQLIFEAVKEHIKHEQPKWAGAYLNQLFQDSSRDLSDYMELFANFPAQSRTLQSRLMKRSGPEPAFEAFLKTTLAGKPALEIIIDPEFTLDQFKWPFGWKLNKDVVDRNHNGGLSLIYFGRGTPLLLEQISKVELGKFRTNISMYGEASRAKGYYALHLKCWNGAEVGKLIVDTLTLQTQVFNFDFEITNEDCTFIQVQLFGQAGNFPVPTRAQINSIQIKPAEVE